MSGAKPNPRLLIPFGAALLLFALFIYFQFAGMRDSSERWLNWGIGWTCFTAAWLLLHFFKPNPPEDPAALRIVKRGTAVSQLSALALAGIFGIALVVIGFVKYSVDWFTVFMGLVFVAGTIGIAFRKQPWKEVRA